MIFCPRMYGFTLVVTPGLFWCWVNENPVCWPETSCVVTNFLSWLDTQIVMLVRLVCDLQLAHHRHEDDAVEVRLRNAFLAEVVEKCCLIVASTCAEVKPRLALNSQSRNSALMPFEVFDPPSLLFSNHLPSHFASSFLPDTKQKIHHCSLSCFERLEVIIFEQEVVVKTHQASSKDVQDELNVRVHVYHCGPYRYILSRA